MNEQFLESVESRLNIFNIKASLEAEEKQYGGKKITKLRKGWTDIIADHIIKASNIR